MSVETLEAPAPQRTAYDRIGGAPAVRRVVDRFYVSLLLDPQLSHYFAAVDMARLKGHQAALLTQVLGGPGRYSGRDLAVAHQHLRVTGADFDRVGEHLIGVLREAGAPEDIVMSVGETLAGVRDQVVTAPDPQPAPPRPASRQFPWLPLVATAVAVMTMVAMLRRRRGSRARTAPAPATRRAQDAAPVPATSAQCAAPGTD